jgi:DNA-binding response OmpR family regulator
MQKPRVLVVDDDPCIRKFVCANLDARDYEVLPATNGLDALEVFKKEHPDLVILDIMMPGIDGFEVCRRIREWSNIPIIVLSAREGETDKVRCLDCGADDYLTKPFYLRELLSRIKAVLRRTQDPGNLRVLPKYRYEDLEVDLSQNEVSLNGEVLSLTGTEYKILSYLVTNAGRLITSDQILRKIWGEDYLGDHHVIQVNIGRLRKRLNDNGRISKYIETRPGIGYRFKLAPC